MKMVFIALVAASVLMMTGCRENVPARQLAEGEIAAILLTDGSGIDDRSFNAAAWQGLLNFYGETWGYTPTHASLFNFMTAEDELAFIPNMRLAVDEGFDLIIAAGFTWEDAVRQVAGLYPDRNFLLVDVDGLGLPNVMEAVFAEHEGSFLVGAAAALTAVEEGIENPRFGFIGGIAGTVITRFHVGFAQGVLSVIPGADILDFYVNSWDEPALARTQAFNWFNDGVFAIFSAAGASGNGTILEAVAQRQAGRNVWAIGVDSDQFWVGLYPNHLEGPYSAVLTSMLKRVEESVVYALTAVVEDDFDGRTIVFDLPREGVGFSTTNPALRPNVIAQVEEIRERIISGDIVVLPTLAEAMLLPGFPQDLMAIDG